MELKQPLTINQQLDRLKAHNIIVDNDVYAMDVLSRINYYRLSGYALQFRTNKNSSHCNSGTTFQSICDIYLFDEELRNCLRLYIEKAEVRCRTVISYIFSCHNCNVYPYDQHYDPALFTNQKGYKEVMDSIKTAKKYYQDSPVVRHHKQKYSGKMPLWVIVELLSFSNLSKLYNSMHQNDKNLISSAMNTGPKALENHLHCLSVLRNKCAHAARLYYSEFNPPARFNTSFLRKHPDIKKASLFAYILILLKLLPKSEDRVNLTSELIAILNKHSNYVNLDLIGFPHNYEDILNNYCK